MVKVTVDHRSLLETNATAAESSAEAYIQETAEAYRLFETKVSGSEGSAIQAFVNKLNTLNTQVFSVYPLTLKAYSKALMAYLNALSDAGFSSEMIYTKESDINAIKTWLTDQRYNSIEEKGLALDRALATAIDVLSQSPEPVDLGTVDTTAIVSDAFSDLTALGNDRVTKHEELTSALDQFKRDLDTLIVDLHALKAVVINAQGMSVFPPATLYNLLVDGKLTAETMSTLDIVASRGDGVMLDVLLREGEDKEVFYQSLGQVDATHVSDGMMDLAYARFYANAVFGENDKEVEAFFHSLAEQDQAKVQLYLEKMIYSGDRYALVQSGIAISLLPVFPKEAASEEDYQKYLDEWNVLVDSGQLAGIQETLTKGGIITSLFVSAHVRKVGKFGDGVDVDSQSTVTNLKYDSDIEAYTWENTIKNRDREVVSDIITANSYVTHEEVYEAGLVIEADELDRKRAEAQQEFILELASLGSHFVAPQFVPLLSVVSALSSYEDSPSNRIGLFDKGASLAFGSTYSGISDGVGHGQSVIASIEKFQALSQEQSVNQAEIEASMFNGGGFTSVAENGIGHQEARFTSTYDLGSTLARHDMDENGLRGVVYRNSSLFGGEPNMKKGLEALKNFDDTMKAYSVDGQETLDNGGTVPRQEIASYIAGNSDQNLRDLNPTNVHKVLDKLKKKELREFEIDNSLEKNQQQFDGLAGVAKEVTP